MKKWYIQMDGKQHGPFVIEELASLKSQGKFSGQSRVWMKVGEKFEWVKAQDVPLLKPLFQAGAEARDTEEGWDGIFDLQSDSRQLSQRPDKIWAFASGKGGVGKTLLASAFSIVLANLGKKTVIVDLDLGGANMHTIFGLPQPTLTLDDFFSKKIKNINEARLQTRVSHLSLISGLGGCLGYANPKHVQKMKIISKLREIDADYVVLDIGAGNSYNELDFFLSADRQIVVTSPEPHSISDGYHFVKTALYRKLRLFFRRHSTIVEFLDQCRERGYASEMNVLLSRIFELGPEYVETFGRILREYSPELVVNMVMEKKEAEEGFSCVNAAKKFLNIDLQFLGFVYFDMEVRKATKELTPFVLKNPEGRASSCILNILFERMLRIGAEEGIERKRKIVEVLKASAYPVSTLNIS